MMAPRRISAALRDAAPVISLIVTLGLAAWIHYDGGERGQIVGFAQATVEAVAPTELARVASVTVDIDAQVVPGQVLATLDTGAIDAELAILSAEKAQIEASMRAEQSTLEQRLAVDVESLQRELAREREDHLRVNAEEKALSGEISRVKRLVEDRQAVLDDLSLLDVRHATVQALAEEKPRTIGLLRTQLAAAEQRRQALGERTSSAAPQLAANLMLAVRRIEALEQRRAGYVLRAAHVGRVAVLDKRPGEVAPAGEPVLQIVSTGGRVVACVPERLAFGIREGDAARLRARGQSGEPLTGKAVALGPMVTELPLRCRPAPAVPVWGREVTIALDQPIEMVAGQAFDIALESSPSAPPAPGAPASAAPAAQANAGDPADPSPMTVPPALLARSRFEPSGILARVDEARYLIVSDDTGRGGDEAVPWLFAMSPGGVVAPDPLPVRGIAELNDLESIAAGDDGAIYVLSSQSHSKKGKRKRSRTTFLRLRPEDRGFRADGEIYLAELLDKADASVIAALGLTDGTRSLEIEGMAFHGGAIYLGLKTPLDAQGNALVWRIASPSALFKSGRLDDAGLSLWARARVDVEAGGKRLPGGISELLFLPDGALAITSTPSLADDETGALWRVDRPEAGVLSPQLIRSFPGLKPEGLALSLSAGKVLVVFDAGAANPSFLELPWGR